MQFVLEYDRWRVGFTCKFRLVCFKLEDFLCMKEHLDQNVYDDSQSPQNGWTNRYIHAEPCIFSPGKIVYAETK